MRTVLRSFLHILELLALTLVIVLVFLLAGIFIIERGPSKEAARLFVLSVRETSAAGFLADLYLSEADIERLTAIKTAPADRSAVAPDDDEQTDVSLVVVNNKDKNNDVIDNGETEAPVTSAGDAVGENESDGIEIYDVTGSTYKGKMLIVKDPSRVILGVPDKYGEDAHGLTVMQMVEKYKAAAGINGGGFYDPNGGGTGGIPDGIVIRDGELLWDNGGTYSTVGFDSNNILHVGRMSASAALDAGITDAVSFGPALIINGKPCNASYRLGGGVNPRTAIGQRSDGAVLMLVINGRALDSLGATYDDLVEIMLSYGAVNACNLDGGSSSLMIYNGEYITRSAYLFGERVVPTAFLVR